MAQLGCCAVLRRGRPIRGRERGRSLLPSPPARFAAALRGFASACPDPSAGPRFRCDRGLLIVAALPDAGHDIVFATEHGGSAPRWTSDCSTGSSSAGSGPTRSRRRSTGNLSRRRRFNNRSHGRTCEPATMTVSCSRAATPLACARPPLDGARRQGGRVLGAGSAGRRDLPWRSRVGPHPRPAQRTERDRRSEDHLPAEIHGTGRGPPHGVEAGPLLPDLPGVRPGRGHSCPQQPEPVRPWPTHPASGHLHGRQRRLCRPGRQLPVRALARRRLPVRRTVSAPARGDVRSAG